MKKVILLSALCIALSACNSTKKPIENADSNTAAVNHPKTPASPETPTIPEVKKPVVKTMLIGKESRQALTQAPFNSWFSKNYDAYPIKETVTPKLKKALKGVELTTFMGTWCGDSKRETPRMLKILDVADFKEKDFELITVDRSKKKPTEYTTGNNIIRVPTFIFKRDGKEIGRIVERPVESLEADMLKILNGEPYKHAYEN